MNGHYLLRWKEHVHRAEPDAHSRYLDVALEEAAYNIVVFGLVRDDDAVVLLPRRLPVATHAALPLGAHPCGHCAFLVRLIGADRIRYFMRIAR